MPFIEDTLGTVLENVVANDPDREFMVYPDRDLRFTYKEFDERVNTFAKGLLAIGIGKGDHVGIWAKNVPDWLTFMFATAKIGAVLVTVNTAYKSHEVEYVIKQSDMKAIAIIDGFRDVNYIDIMYELVPELKTQQRGKLRSERFPFLKRVIFIGQEKHRGMYNSAEILLLGKHGNEEEFQRIKQSLDCNDVVNM
ncbi:MAG: AMP-binding protein, partial [Methanomethylovorans sp.]|nr:AMP-binding protein [Methanomethylovorans sp.]